MSQKGREAKLGEKNPMFGKHHSKKAKQKIRDGHIGEKNANWKGNNVGYKELHNWVRRHKPKPKICEMCKKEPPYDVANISGEYKRDINDYQWLGRRCHMISDGRMNNLKQYQGG